MDFLKARVQPIYKSGSKLSVENYRPVSLLSIPSKTLHKAINSDFQEYNKNKVLNRQAIRRPPQSLMRNRIALLYGRPMGPKRIDHGYT